MTEARTARTAGLALALVAVMMLTGCVTSFLPKPETTTSTPTNEKVAADLAPYYKQVLRWSACGAFHCADATVPLDWNAPSGATITLALIRKSATGTSHGSLLVNPGGPGASGYDFIRDSLSYAVSPKLQAAYDIVGFDPRGVNRSSAVKCYDDPKQMDAFLYDIPPFPIGTDQWIDYQENSNAEFGKACQSFTGALLGHVDTVSAARDLDVLRAALGDKKLNYLGYSYGTLLGGTYAELFPKKTGRLVFDGAVDPATTEFEVTKTQATGFESALRAFVTDCLSGSKCPFRGSVDDAMHTIRGLLDSLDASPLRADDGRMLGSATMFSAIILPLYSHSNWPYLTDLFGKVMNGDANYAFQLADSYNNRRPGGGYNDNSTEAFIAINCLDYKTTSTRASLREEAAQLKAAAPVLGPQMAYGGTSCANWPFPATRDREPIVAAGSAPILVVGTTNDPATPYVWAKTVAKELQNGHLVTFHGEGHTAYNKSNSCVNDAVDGFFVDGTVPKKDPQC
ncbi:alpha/beta hydrolase [Parafrigoribacterium mesophilum]|uniref:alpha/beta hydrolase n=1 Tax=Parafrigoribacterium mesophilum TaxID=433646 RepID=UPI0031FD0DC3